MWVDGVLAPADDPRVRVSVFDHALLTGDGVFETLKIVRGVPFAMRRHLERLRRSADGLGLRCPDDSTVRRAAAEVVAANGLETGRVRITLTGGVAPLGSDRGDTPPTLIVAATPAPVRPPVTDVVTVPWPRNERGAVAGLKTVSYAENVVALAYAAERGAGEAVFADTRGRLSEGTGSNVFLVLEGRLVTPALTTGCLRGVTRDLIIELCGAEEVEIPVARLWEASEAFLTSSTRDVQAIGAVDGRPLPAAPGPRTAEVAAAFARLLDSDDLDP